MERQHDTALPVGRFCFYGWSRGARELGGVEVAAHGTIWRLGCSRVRRHGFSRALIRGASFRIAHGGLLSLGLILGSDDVDALRGLAAPSESNGWVRNADAISGAAPYLLLVCGSFCCSPFTPRRAFCSRAASLLWA